MYRRLNLSTTPNLKFYKRQHCTALDPINNNFKAKFKFNIQFSLKSTTWDSNIQSPHTFTGYSNNNLHALEIITLYWNYIHKIYKLHKILVSTFAIGQIQDTSLHNINLQLAKSNMKYNLLKVGNTTLPLYWTAQYAVILVVWFRVYALLFNGCSDS
jgi:hypothetical protein